MESKKKNAYSSICQAPFPSWPTCALQRQFRGREIPNGKLHSHTQSLRFFWSRGRRKEQFFFKDILRRVALETRIGELSKDNIKIAAQDHCSIVVRKTKHGQACHLEK